MKPPISLLIFHGDGRGVSRFLVPRWVAYAALGMIGAVATYIVVLSGERMLLDQQWSQVASLRQRLDDERALIESFQPRMAAVRHEIGKWEDVHARMRAAFDPSAPTQPAEPDIEATTAAPNPSDQLELLISTVAQEGPRLQELEQVVTRTSKLVGSLPLQWPIRGGIKSEFGMRKSPWDGQPEFHKGIDIGSPPGTAVLTPAPGRVVAATSGGGYGKHVTIDHGNRIKSRYGHLMRLDVRVGDQVDRGDVIGLVGSTGRSTGPHLHYEVLVEGRQVNPREFLRQDAPRLKPVTRAVAAPAEFSPSQGFAQVCTGR